MQENLCGNRCEYHRCTPGVRPGRGPATSAGLRETAPFNAIISTSGGGKMQLKRNLLSVALASATMMLTAQAYAQSTTTTDQT
jgi:hypothetical protein